MFYVSPIPAITPSSICSMAPCSMQKQPQKMRENMIRDLESTGRIMQWVIVVSYILLFGYN